MRMPSRVCGACARAGLLDCWPRVASSVVRVAVDLEGRARDPGDCWPLFVCCSFRVEGAGYCRDIDCTSSQLHVLHSTRGVKGRGPAIVSTGDSALQLLDSECSVVGGWWPTWQRVETPRTHEAQTVTVDWSLFDGARIVSDSRASIGDLDARKVALGPPRSTVLYHLGHLRRPSYARAILFAFHYLSPAHK